MTNLIVISSETNVENETSIINRLFHSGMRLFHLRKPLFTCDQQRSFLQRVEVQFHDKISVHQHFETVVEFGLKYYHVKENQRPAFAERASTSFPMITTSTSFHSYSELKDNHQLWNYSFLSPVYDSISKSGYRANFSDDFVIEETVRSKIFALGGITKENIEQVLKRGFYGAAVLGSIWNEPSSALKNFKEIETLCRQSVHMY